MNNPINVAMAMLILALACAGAALAWSPDLLDIWARKMRARARAIRASRKCWNATYNESITEDVMREQERSEMAALIGIELRDE